ncbi:hypothetical protein FQN53_000298 [Emmonsiellopsis sp. PD_33]|nr:hypothetical protein FQN53_000298 [Emmonsiellopsis sp. PD_33]
MVNLGPYITRDAHGKQEFECAYCYKTTNSFQALHQHCRVSPSHSWCGRCERVFRDASAKADHEKHSSNHHLCYPCRLDFTTNGQLEQHVVDHHRCPHCDWSGDDNDDLAQHKAEAHHICEQCGERFENNNDLRLHQTIHQPSYEECYGCDREFHTFSAMLIHLEAEKCNDAGLKDQFYHSAGRYYKENHQYRGEPWFDCPECNKSFKTLSGLYQHAEMRPGCSYLLDNGNFLDGLKEYIWEYVHYII